MLISSLCLSASQAPSGASQGNALAATRLWAPYYPSYYAPAPMYSYPQYQYEYAQQAPATSPGSMQSLVAKVQTPFYKPAQNIKTWGAQRVKFEVARLMKEEDLSVKAEEKMATAVSTLANEVEQMKVQTAVEKVDGDEGRLTTRLVSGPPGPPGPEGRAGPPGAPGAQGLVGAPGPVEYLPEPTYTPQELSYSGPPPQGAQIAQDSPAPARPTAALEKAQASKAPKASKPRAEVAPKQKLVAMHSDPLAGSLFAVQVPDGLKPGSVFEAEVPGHGLEAVTVPKGVHSGQVIDIETTDPVKQQQKRAKAASPVVPTAHATPPVAVSMPPPKAPPPLNAFQREQVRAALGHETYQEVVDEALKVDRAAARHAGPTVGTTRSDGDTITISAPAAIVKTPAGAGAQAEQSSRAHAALGARSLPTSLRKAAMSVHKIQTQQKALESSVQNLEAAASKFMAAHSRGQPAQSQGRDRHNYHLMIAMCLRTKLALAREKAGGGVSLPGLWFLEVVTGMRVACACPSKSPHVCYVC